jgi:hypothetical protein
MTGRKRAGTTVVVDLGARGIESVWFPADQPGASSLIGYFGGPDGAHVLKVLKVPTVRSWILGHGTITEPFYVQVMRRVPMRNSAFAPTLEMRDRVGFYNETCVAWLRGVDRDRAAEALAQVPVGGSRRHITALLDELYSNGGPLDFAPTLSELVDVGFPPAGPEKVPALVQEDISGARAAPAEPYLHPLDQRGVARRDEPLRRSQISFLVMAAMAWTLARNHHLGLDLSPRPGPRGKLAVRLPNVLIRPDRTLAYVDFFGLSRPDGNLSERLGHRVLYGEHGALTCCVRRLVRHLTQDPT